MGALILFLARLACLGVDAACADLEPANSGEAECAALLHFVLTQVSRSCRARCEFDIHARGNSLAKNDLKRLFRFGLSVLLGAECAQHAPISGQARRTAAVWRRSAQNCLCRPRASLRASRHMKPRSLLFAAICPNINPHHSIRASRSKSNNKSRFGSRRPPTSSPSRNCRWFRQACFPNPLSWIYRRHPLRAC